MAKNKTVFFCNECGYESSGWLGKCPACGQWNTFVEEKINDKSSGGNSFGFDLGNKLKSGAVSIKSIEADHETRCSSGINELDRVLGGGIVKGSLVLISGDPGIGKSTLMLMISGNISKFQKVLYVSGEESAPQIKMRADRLGVTEDNLYIYPENSVPAIIEQIKELNPDTIIIDSIQTLSDPDISSAPGSVSQIRENTATFLKIAKSLNITVFIVGHVTKEGSIAGPKILEHMVDTVLYFEGERHLSYRILRAVKNRFGSTNEIGVFEMCENGLKEIDNPSVAMLEGRPTDAQGTSVFCAIEGTRPMLLEIQALISESKYENPRRMCTGLDYNRVSLLIAVMEKKARYRLGVCDAFVNVIGGIKLTEPASDLAVVAAVSSSYRNIILPSNAVFIGEVGLAGEIRAVNQIGKRLSEAFRLGFNLAIIPEGNRKTLAGSDFSGKIIYVNNINEITKLMDNDFKEDYK